MLFNAIAMRCFASLNMTWNLVDSHCISRITSPFHLVISSPYSKEPTMSPTTNLDALLALPIFYDDVTLSRDGKWAA